MRQGRNFNELPPQILAVALLLVGTPLFEVSLFTLSLLLGLLGFVVARTKQFSQPHLFLSFLLVAPAIMSSLYGLSSFESQAVIYRFVVVVFLALVLVSVLSAEALLEAIGVALFAILSIHASSLILGHLFANQSFAAYTLNKQLIGIACSIALLLTPELIRKNVVLSIALFPMALALLSISSSLSSVGSVAFGLVFLVASESSFARENKWLRPTAVSAMVLGPALIILSLRTHVGEYILALLGRESTITGRTVIWDAVFWTSRTQPWFGYGGNPWEEAEVVPRLAYSLAGAYFKPSNSHNLLLDYYLWFGVVGLATLIAALLIPALLTPRHDASSLMRLTVLASLMAIWFFSFFESSVIQHPFLGLLFALFLMKNWEDLNLGRRGKGGKIVRQALE